MSDLKIYDDYNTLPEQVQINKDDIAKLKDDINKIKPNAWEERKFILDNGDGSHSSFSTYNPITNESNPMVNIQRAFTDKETYSLTDKINSFSFSASSPSIFAYLVCGDPSLTLNELFGLEETAKNCIVLANTDVGGDGEYWLLINCRLVDTFSLFTSSLSFDRKNTDIYIDKISTDDDKLEHSMLTAKAVDQYYLKKSDASNTYATKLEHEANQADIVKLTKRVDSLDMATIDVSLTASGFEKIQVNPTIGTPIKLIKNTDFDIEIAQYDDDTESIAFSLYKDSDEEFYIALNIKLNVQKTTDYYADNDQPYIWWTGVGVIKFGNPTDSGNQYLCHIAYSYSYDNGLVIIPISKLV